MCAVLDMSVSIGLIAVFYYSYTPLTQVIGTFSPYWIVPIVVYYFYYRFFAHYLYRQPEAFTQGRRMMGKTLPAFPNGWVMVSRSQELPKGAVKYVTQSGLHVALFRGEDGVAYAVDAYCPHIGANLGIGGKVVHQTCIQCPFHGWEFDGKTGKLVNGREKKPLTTSKYVYSPKVGDTQSPYTERLTHSADEQTAVGTWKLKEMYGYIFIWVHALKQDPEYEPFDITEFTQRLRFRGTSINVINSHVQDIVENGGDVKHFLYVHSALLPFTDFIGATWRAKWRPGDDPNLRKELEHDIPWVQAYKTKIFDRFLNDKNKKYIGCLSLDNYVTLGGSKPIFFFNASVFQVGPGLVYLFLVSPFYEAVFFQHTTQVQKYTQEVYHELYASWYLPYCVTALFLRLESQQVMNDGVIWDNKKFGLEPRLRKDLESDAMILMWRRWFAQFYEGCREKEESEGKYVW